MDVTVDGILERYKNVYYLRNLKIYVERNHAHTPLKNKVFIQNIEYYRNNNNESL